MNPDPMVRLLLPGTVLPYEVDDAHESSARLPIILVSSHNEAFSLRPGGFQVLRKPRPVDQFAQILRAELGTYPGIVVDHRRGVTPRFPSSCVDWFEHPWETTRHD